MNIKQILDNGNDLSVAYKAKRTGKFTGRIADAVRSKYSPIVCQLAGKR